MILITGHGDVSMAVDAMRIGAYDFLEKPFNPERMAELAKRAVQTRYLSWFGCWHENPKEAICK